MGRGNAMNLSRLSLAGLQLRLALTRFGWINAIAIGLLLAGVCTWWLVIGYLSAQTHAPLRSLENAEAQLKAINLEGPSDGRSLLEERLASFHHVLGDVRYAEQQVKTLFAIAAKTGLVLQQAEYRAAFDRNSRVTTYQILLPVKGSYQAIRQFSEQTLLAISFASLDEVNFKRDTISNGTIEAKLRFTLYLGDSRPSPAFVPVEHVSANKGGRS
jgi:hypothetical protein